MEYQDRIIKRIPVIENILSANDRLADQNRRILDRSRIFSLNFMASPGAGKTSVIETTVRQLKQEISIAVIDGDIATNLDANRAQLAGAQAVQINTGGDCHLDAVMLHDALKHLELSSVDVLIVENVGNLVCPANFKLGTHKNILIASIPEGDDKPYKYPGIYRGIDVLLINKIDLLPYVSFRMDYFLQGVEILNPGLGTFQISCQTGEGFTAWLDWLKKETANYKSSLAER